MSISAPHIIVLGNEKGGTGKSTTAIHIIASCLEEGLSVGALDLDGRQKSLTRYLENRAAFAEREDIELTMPVFWALQPTELPTRSASEEADRQAFTEAFALVSIAADVVVIDTPGANSYLGRLAHKIADTLVTPMNDSFVDFDVLGLVDPATGRVKRPSVYSEMVWEARKNKAAKGGKPIDWIVVRNRLSTLNAHNKRRVDAAVKELAKRIGFRFEPGLSERVIYRELFVKGLTLMDFASGALGELSMSHIAARQELRDLVRSLHIPQLSEEEKLTA